MKYIISSDWDITEKRIPILEGPIDEISKLVISTKADAFILAGDLFGQFSPKTVAFVRSVLKKIGLLGEIPILLLVGNHDRVIGIDRLTALFSGDYEVFYQPGTWTAPDGTQLAFLPAPDRAEIGTALLAQGPRERDATISDILRAVLINLEAGVVAPIEEVPIIFHATVNSTVFNGSVLSEGLTWTIDAGQLASWGAAIGGHIHTPSDFSSEIVIPGRELPTQIVYTGTIAHDRHGKKAEDFRVIFLQVDRGKSPKVLSFPIKRSSLPLEFTIGEEQLLRLVKEDLATMIVSMLEEAGASNEDNIDLKLRLRLQRAALDIFPKDEHIKKDLIDLGYYITSLIVKREEIGTEKDELEGRDLHGLKFSDLLFAWGEASGIEKEQTKKAVGLLETLEDVPSWIVEGNLGVRLISTKLVNFRQWEDATIPWEDLEGTTAVIGDNEVGKTNFIEAPLFAWYKKTPRTEGQAVGLRYELQNGADKGHVEHVWESGGIRYMVRRAMERAKSGEVSCKSELFKVFNPDFDVPGALNAIATGNDVDKKISEIVGPYDFVCSTFYGTAMQIDKLLDATPAKNHEILIEALSLRRFEALRERCRRQRSSLETEMEKGAAVIEELEGQLVIRREELIDLNEGAATADELAQLENLAEIKERAALIAGDLEKQLREAAYDIKQKRKRLDPIEERLDSIARKLIELSEMENPGDRPEQIDPKKIESLGEQIQAEKDHLELTEKVGEDKRIRIIEIEHEIKNEKQSLVKGEKEIDRLEGEIDSLSKTTRPRAPCMGPPGSFAGQELWHECVAWKAYSFEGDLIRLREKISETTTENFDLIEKIKELMDALGRVVGCFNEHSIAATDLKGGISTLEKQLQELKEKDAHFEIWTAKSQAYKTISPQEFELGIEKKKLKEELASIPLVHVSLEAAKRVSEAEGHLKKLWDELKDYESKISSGERSIALVNEKKKQIRGAHDRILEIKSEQSSSRGEMLNWSTLESAFHATGIPYMLIKRVVPAYQEEVNRLLAGSHLSVKINLGREIGTGGEKKIVDEIYVTYSDLRGTFPLKIASGEQRSSLGLALRAGLAKVGSEFWGRIPEIFVQDEGFGAFHNDRLPLAADLIRRISSQFKRFVFITHKDGLAENADNVIIVKATASGSPEITRQ